MGVLVQVLFSFLIGTGDVGGVSITTISSSFVLNEMWRDFAVVVEVRVPWLKVALASSKINWNSFSLYVRTFCWSCFTNLVSAFTCLPRVRIFSKLPSVELVLRVLVGLSVFFNSEMSFSTSLTTSWVLTLNVKEMSSSSLLESLPWTSK